MRDAPPSLSRWRRQQASAPLSLPRSWRRWLLDPGSLTELLVAASGGDFRVEVLAQSLRRPAREERMALGLPERRVALVREVLLHGRGKPWVYARSVVPLAVLRGRHGFLRHLGDKPLGALLFRDAAIRRGAIEVARRIPPPLPGRPPSGPLWARRSLFHLGRQRVLVAEMFLPGFTPDFLPHLGAHRTTKDGSAFATR